MSVTDAMLDWAENFRMLPLPLPGFSDWAVKGL